ncbi:MAG: DNA cytosine methyltransferase [Gammaproteobacteria bacterium]|nr:DNA cytosine methyltransferase [Gammaproteobacteria bacterium]
MLTPGPFVDLFSGAGGLSLGLEWAGFEPLLAVDHDVAANETFRENRPAGVTALAADLSDPSHLRAALHEIRCRAERRGAIALVAGGPPCQGFSTAGQCRPDDPRNELLFAFLNVIGDLRPLQVLMENVAALTFRRHIGVLEETRSFLSRMGYRTSAIVAHAEGYGVPQLRRRLFVMAARTTEPRWPRPWRRILPPMMSKYQPVAPDAVLDGPVTVEEAIADLPTQTAESPDEPINYGRAATSEYQRWIRGEGDLAALCAAPVAAELPPSLFDMGNH